MTQSKNQSVRNEAESAVESPRIPTFEEVYEISYVQESIESVITSAIHRYPVLANYRDDIRQVILLHLNDDLARFNGRSGIKTFARMSIDTGIKMAMREYLTMENYTLHLAKDIESVPENEICAAGYIDSDPLAYIELCELEEAVAAIKDPVLRDIVDMLLDRKSLKTVANKLNIPRSTLYNKYLPLVKRFFRKKCSKRAIFFGHFS